MKFITRDTDYALKALLFMAKQLKESNLKVVSVDMIVQEEDLPRVFLRRLLQRLAKKKILVSYKGKGGGFSFLKAPDNIFLTDIINIFQGPVDLNHCFLKGDICPDRGRCKVRRKIKSLSNMVKEELSQTTISSLL